LDRQFVMVERPVVILILEDGHAVCPALQLQGVDGADGDRPTLDQTFYGLGQGGFGVVGNVVGLLCCLSQFFGPFLLADEHH